MHFYIRFQTVLFHEYTILLIWFMEFLLEIVANIQIKRKNYVACVNLIEHVVTVV